MKDSLIKNKLLGKTIPISKIDHTINAQRASKAGPLGTISRESSYTPGSPLVGANALYLSERPLRGESEGPFFNFTFDKGRLKNLVSWTLQHYGHYKTVELLEQLKKTGFEYATKAGISLGIDDLKIPPKKHVLLLSAEQLTKVTSQQYQRGDITAIERFQRLIDTWHRTSEQLKQEVISHFEETDILNPVYMMAFSGARGNISQVRQLVGMRGLMSDPQGQIIDFPIQSNFREGLTLTEYIISSYGARKGIVDTALRTANAGYLTRRLVDVAQHVIISHYDCGTKKGIFLLDMKEGNKTIVSARTRIIGRVLARDIYKPKTNIKIFSRNQEITTDVAFEITKYTNKVFVRSALTCNTTKLICQLCYGWSLAQGNLVSVGETVGVIAAQSIGEPGTQLTMRTFHTGGVFSGDVSDEIRAPYNGFVHYDNIIPGILIRTLDGKIGFLTKSDGFLFFSLNKKLDLSSDIKKYKIPPYTLLLVRNGESVIQKQVVAQITSIGSLQTTKRDTAELVIKSDFEGLFYAKNLQIKKSIIGPKPKFMGPGKEKLVMDPKAMEIVVKARGWNFAWVLSGKRYEIPLLLKSFPRIGDYITKQTIMARHYSAVDNQLSTRATRETTADNVFAAHRANKAEVLYLKTYKTKLKGLFIFENFQKLRLFRRAKNYKQIVNGFYTKFSHVKSFKYFKSDFALLKADLGQQPARYKFGARLPQSGTQRGSAQRANTLFPDMLLPQRGNDDVNQSTYSQRFLAAPLVNSAFAPSAISYPPGAAQRAPLGNILPQRGPEGGTKYIAYKKIKYHKIGYFQFLNTRLIIFPKNYNFLFFDFQPDCTPSGFGLRASSSFQPAGLDFFENIPYTEFKFNYNFINSHVFFSASSFKKDSKHKPSILLKRFKPKTDLFFSLSPVGPKLLPLCGTQNVVAVKLNKPFGPKRGFSHFEKTRLVRTDFAFCKASFIKTLQNNILSVNVLKNSTVTQKTNVLTIDGLSKKTQTRLNHLINTYKTIKCFKKQYKFYKNVIHYKKAHKQGYTSINYHRRGAAKDKQQPKGAESFINSSSHHFLKNQQTSYQTLLVKSWLNNKNNVVHSLPATKKRRPFGQYIAHKNTLVLNKFNKAPILSIFEKNQILITSNEPLLTKLNKKAQFKKGFLFGFSKAQKIDFLNFGTISYPPGPLWAHISLKSAPFGVPILAKQELSDRDVLPLGPQRISACTNQSIFVENVSKIKIFEYSKIFATDIRKKCILKHFNVGVTTNLAFQPAIYAQRAINKIQKYEQKQHTKIKAALKNIVKDNAKTPNTFVSQKLLINKNHLCLISNYFALKKTNFKTVNNILHTEITLSCPPEPKGLASLSPRRGESQTTRAQRASLYSYPEGGAKRPEGGAKRPEGAPEVGACTNPSERRERQTTHVFTKNWCNTLYSRLNKLFFSYMIVYNTQKITKKTKLKNKKLLLNKGTKKLVYLFKDNVLLSERNNQVFFACINKEKGAPLGPLQPLRSLPKGPLWLSRCPVGAKAIYARRGNAGRDALWAYIAGHPEGLLCPPEGAKAEGGNILGNADRDKTVWVYKTRRIVSQIKTAFSPISYPFGAPFGQYKAHNQNIVTYPGKSSVDNLVFYNNKINPHFNISMKMLSKLETKNAVSKQKPYPIFEVVKQIGRSYTTQTTFTQPQRATYCALQGALGASSPAKRDFLVTPKGAQRAAKREKHVVPQRGMGPKMSANKPSEPQKAPEGLPPGPLEVPERAFRQTSIPDPAVVRDLNKLFKTEILKQNFVWIKNKKPRFLPKQLEKQKQASSFNSPGGAEGSIGDANRSTNSYPFGAGGAVTEINIFSNSYLYNIFSCFVLDLWSNISPQEHTSFSENQLLSILHILLSSCAEVQKNLTQLVELTLGVSSFGKDFIGHPKGAKAFAPASGVSAQSAFSPKVGANTLEKIINSFKLLKKNLKQIVIKTTSTYILFRPLPEILFLDKFKKFVLHKKIFHKLRKKNNSTKFISDWQSTICYHPGQRGPEGQQYLSRLFKGAREAEGSYPRNMFASLKGPTVKKIYYPKGGAFVQGIYSQRTAASINRWEYIENFIKAKQKRDLNLLPKSPITYQLSKSGGPVAFAPFQPSGHILPRGLKGSSVSVTNVPLTLSYPSGLRGSIGNKFPGFQPFGHILRGRRASRVSSFRRGKSNNCKINKSWKHFGETNYFSPYQGELLYTKPYKTYLDLNPYENLKTGLKNAYLPLWATSLSESPKGLAGFAVGQYIAGFGGSKGYPENLKKTKEEKIRIKMFQYYLKTLNRQKTSHQKGWSRCSLILTKTDLITLNYVGSSEQNRTIFSEIKIPSCFNSPEGVTDGVTNVPKISYEQAFLNNLVKPSLKNNNQFTTLSQLNKTYHFNKTYCFNMKKLWLTHSVTKIYAKGAIYESLLCPPGRVYQIKTRVPVKSKTSKQIGNYISPSSVCYQMPLWTERIEQLFVPKGQTQYIAQRGPKGKTTPLRAYITNVTKKLEKDTKIYYSSFLCIKLKLWFKTKNKPCFKTKQLQPYFERTNFKWLFLKQKNLRIKNKVGFFFLKGSYFVPGYILPSGLKAPKDILPPMAINQEKARYLEPWRANNASYTNVITFGGRLLNKKTYDFRSLESKITFELQKFHLNGYFLTLKPEYDKTFFALKVILNSLSNAFISAQGAYLDFIGPPEGAKAISAQKGIAVYKNTIFSNLQNIDKSHVLLIKRQKFSMLKPINYNTFSYTHKEINYCKSFEALSSPSEKALWDRLRLIYNMLRITSIYKNKNFIFTEARAFGRFAPEGNSLPISSDALRCPPKGRQYITAFLSESRQLCAQSLSDSYVAYLFNPERPMRDDKQVQVLKKSGQLVHMNKQKITLRIGQPLVISPRSIIHNTHGDFINNKTTVITLTYEQLKTGDIVQGIPKIEQLFEARTTKRGRLFRDNISNLLTGLFLKYFIKSTSLLSKNSIKLSSLKVVSSLPQRGPFAARDREAGQSERHISFWRGNNVVTFGPNGTKQNQTMLLALALQWSVKQSFYKIQQIIVDGILRVYRSQGVSIADKHVEIIVKQMTSKVRIINYNKAKMNDYIFSLKNINPYFVKNPQRAYIVDKQGVPVLLQQPKRKEPTDAKTLETLFVSNVDGATGLFPGEIVDHSFVLNINTFLLKTANVDQLQMSNSPESPFAIEPIKYEPIVLGITRASLEVDSFLSAASFQQTTKVLSQAALYKKKDFLKGLKENIIIGNLIPAGTGYLSSPRLGAN